MNENENKNENENEKSKNKKKDANIKKLIEEPKKIKSPNWLDKNKFKEILQQQIWQQQIWSQK